MPKKREKTKLLREQVESEYFGFVDDDKIEKT